MSSPMVTAERMALLPYLVRMPSTVRSNCSRRSRRGVASAAKRSSCAPASPSGIRFWPVMVRARMGALPLQEDWISPRAARPMSWAVQEGASSRVWRQISLKLGSGW